jgi:putative transcriptional regulator
MRHPVRMVGEPGGRHPIAGSLRGQLLVASPHLLDPRFRRAVLLVLDHGGEGALAVVLNHPTPVPVADVLPAWRELVSPPDVVFAGGPVGTDSALGVASIATSPGGESPLGWKRLHDSTGLVDLDTPPELLAPALQGLRIFAGYAGWSARQLEEELSEGSWYVVDPAMADVFGAEPEDLWRQVLRRQSGPLAFVASFPDDPAMN